MNERLISDAFNSLRPYCVSLSAVSLRNPAASVPHLKALHTALQSTDQDAVSENFANYLFFPLKPLFKPGLAEDITAEVFNILRWLLHTRWYTKSEEMTVQLITLFTTSLAKAKGEELRNTLIASCQELFMVAGKRVNIIKSRPSLAYLSTAFLSEESSIQNQVASLRALRALYSQLDGDAAASFLPGTVSSLSRILVKTNQRSTILVAGIECLQESIASSMDGVMTAYRSEKWLAATQSQLLLALTPVLAHLNSSTYDTVRQATCELCKSVLEHDILAPLIFVECLLHFGVDAIPGKHRSEVAKIVETYIDASIRILSGVDERRKINMLSTLQAAIPLISRTSRQILCERFVSHILTFLKSTTNTRTIATVSYDERPQEPDFQYISNDVRDALATLLKACKIPNDFSFDKTENFWVAQKLGLDTYSHAILSLSTHTNLSLVSIVAEAERRGTEYRSDLMQVLYPLLSLPQPNMYVLQAISNACQYEDVQTMVVDNADYIVNSLNLAFVTLNISPRTPKVLGIIVQLAPAMVELVDDVVDTFFDVLDSYHGHLGIVEGIFSGLLGVVKSVANKPVPSAFTATIEGLSSTQDGSLEERFDQVEDDARSSKRIAEEEPETMSASYRIVLHILEKAQIFLSHQDSTIKLRALDLLFYGIPIIATNEDKFLPLVHLIWPQLIHRVQDQNPFVVASTLKVIARTVVFAGSFMRMRINDDVIPFVYEVQHPARDKRGNLVHSKKAWEGTGRRKIAEGVQEVLKAVVEDGGLRNDERAKALGLVEELAAKSDVLKNVLLHARELDELSSE